MVGRQFVRYSGTENKIRVPVEHRDAVTADRWIATFSETTTEEIG
jgi:phosphomannomutase